MELAAPKLAPCRWPDTRAWVARTSQLLPDFANGTFAALFASGIEFRAWRSFNQADIAKQFGLLNVTVGTSVRYLATMGVLEKQKLARGNALRLNEGFDPWNTRCALVALPQALMNSGRVAAPDEAVKYEVDIDAAEAWLAQKHSHTPLYPTKRRDLQRFINWCDVELEKDLKSLTPADCERYRVFLTDIPVKWRQPGDQLLDPLFFSEQPRADAQRKVCLFLSQFFAWLVSAGHLRKDVWGAAERATHERGGREDSATRPDSLRHAIEVARRHGYDVCAGKYSLALDPVHEQPVAGVMNSTNATKAPRPSKT